MKARFEYRLMLKRSQTEIVTKEKIDKVDVVIVHFPG